MRIFVDMDGTLAKWNNVSSEQLLEQGYYRNLEANQKLVDDVNSLIKQGEDVYILSCYLTDSKFAFDEKREWIKEYLPELPEEKYILIPYSEPELDKDGNIIKDENGKVKMVQTNKAEYLKEHYSPITNQDYLIDDYTKNLLEWKEYGGIGVKYINGINHTRGTWNGLMINEKTPHYNNTSLFNFILAEKLKDYGIDIIASSDGVNLDITNFECIYNNKYYDLSYVFWDAEHRQKTTINEMIDTIHKELLERKSTLPKNPASDLLTKQYYSRHCPTLSQCRDFEILCEELSTDVLDDMEYTIYLFEVDKDNKYFYLSDECELINNTNNPRALSCYIEWCEMMINTQDLLEEIRSLSLAESYNNDSGCIENNEMEELDEPDICD